MVRVAQIDPDEFRHFLEAVIETGEGKSRSSLKSLVSANVDLLDEVKRLGMTWEDVAELAREKFGVRVPGNLLSKYVSDFHREQASGVLPKRQEAKRRKAMAVQAKAKLEPSVKAEPLQDVSGPNSLIPDFETPGLKTDRTEELPQVQKAGVRGHTVATGSFD